ncbi:MAG: hypothetical protein QHI48_01835 [Bacteroidota bacterium]|nr:hypothetical protein [Bacteroidota bacterium]
MRRHIFWHETRSMSARMEKREAGMPLAVLLTGLLFSMPAGVVKAQYGRVENPHPIPPFDATERLAPPALSFFVIGSWGCGGAEQRNVAEAIRRRHEQEAAAAVLTTGNNFLDEGVAGLDDPQWHSKFEAVFKGAGAYPPFYPTLGISDAKGKADAQILYSSVHGESDHPKWVMPGRCWTALFRANASSLAVRVTGIDTPLIMEGTPMERKEVLRVIDSLLGLNDAAWKIVVGHHPVYSNGRGGNTLGMILSVQPLLEKHGVQAYFAGRDNDLQILAPVRGVRYAVSGAACRTSDTRWADNTLFTDSRFGFLWFQVNEREMLIQAVASDGTVLFAVKSPR